MTLKLNPIDATTPQELIAALSKSDQVLEFVPRTLLIQTLGTEHAQRFLPALPDYVSVNVDSVLMVAKLVTPELIPQAEEPTNESDSDI